MIDAVDIDVKNTKSIITIKPKPPCTPVFQQAVSKMESTIHIINESLNS